MKITVTQKDIKNGKPCKSFLCPIAIAVQRKTKGIYRVMAEELVKKGVVYPLPDIAKEFISRFDEGMPVKPFSFEIYL